MRICDLNPEAEEKLPPRHPDKSGVGVHYMDAYLKPMKKLALEDGTSVDCGRRGLKVTLTIGDRKGEGLMRRLEVSRDPTVMLQAALGEAAGNAGYRFWVEDGGIHLEPLT